MKNEVINGGGFGSARVIGHKTLGRVFDYTMGIISDFTPKVLCIEIGVRRGSNTTMREF